MSNFLTSSLCRSGMAIGFACMLGCSSSVHKTQVAAQQPSSQSSSQQAAATQLLTPEEMQKAFIAASTPSENHKVLNSFIGKWTAETKFWQAPGTQPEVSKGRSEVKSVYGGRFIEEHYQGKFNGLPFEGTGVWGFDNTAQQFQSSWFDSMSTQMMLSSGSYNPTNQTITLSGSVSCPLTGEMKSTKSVTTIIDKNRRTFEMYDTTDDGLPFKALEIAYTRIPEGKKAKGSAN